YDAYEAGVSRLHATIRIEKDKVILIDLGSVNGTRIEGKRLTPHLKHTLRDGDVISLGKMKLKVRIKA
ncbi:MAG: FHA domain-containing protein, partial [Aliifodinibius sp.]|nr:FHA domain-containing protein [candidate division Zixibacteria bacterium]NIT60076.1 FHA domain-containing protein [Fodinibius sp.]NIS47880.1 FHA domain-containing protein [candidate division Zixibacteria bacterium]NIU15998.1 FHA domain-containing protein [candidate division Zixibacteria bacterium]NIV08147.1 FHA domain-containing protein [candidate division Zixibacteria bacterium]